MYYITSIAREAPRPRTSQEALQAIRPRPSWPTTSSKIGIHEPIVVRLPRPIASMVSHRAEGRCRSRCRPSSRVVTTVGRCIFNDILRRDAVLQLRPGQEGLLPRHRRHLRPPGPAGDDRPAGRHQGAGLQALDARGPVLRHHRPPHPRTKQRDPRRTPEEGRRVEKNYHAGAITDHERYNQLLDLWTHCREAGHQGLIKELQNDRRDEQGEPLPIEPGRRQALPQPDLADERLRCPRQRQPDPAARRHARPDGQALRRDHRDADQGQLPRRPDRAGVLLLDPRRPQGPGRHGAEDRRLGLPDPQARRRGPERHRQRARLRHPQRRHQAHHLQGRRGRRARCAT